MKFQELDVARALVPLDNGIMPGDLVTILVVLNRDPDVFDVERVDSDGTSVESYDVPAESLELVLSYEEMKKRSQEKQK